MKSSGPNSVVMNRVYRDYPIRIREYEFLGDLIELSFREFDVILGIDWLSRHQVVVDCRMKRVTLRTRSGEEVSFINERSDHLSNVISAATARIMVQKGSEAYLAYVIDTKKAEPSLSDIPTISDYPDVTPQFIPRIYNKIIIKILGYFWGVTTLPHLRKFRPQNLP